MEIFNKKYKISKNNLISFKFSEFWKRFFIENKLGNSTLTFENYILLKNKESLNFYFSDYSFSKNFINSFLKLAQSLSFGYFSELVLKGVGFKIYFLNNKKILLSLGYSHYFVYDLPNSIIFFVKKGKIFLYSMDKQVLGSVLSDLKNLRIVDPYKGKGLLENGQMLFLKEGKKR